MLGQKGLVDVAAPDTVEKIRSEKMASVLCPILFELLETFIISILRRSFS